MSDLELHSPLGPSSAERWINCPGSVAATKGLPDTTSEYAIEGLGAHLLSELCRNEQMPAKHYIGVDMQVETETGVVPVKVDKEMAYHVQNFVDYVNQFDGDSFYEMRVHYDKWVENGFGTADHITVADGVCRVTDLKYGQGIQVYADNNPQNMHYGLGVYAELGHLYEFDKFILAIHQPRLDHVDEWEISLDDLLQWAEDVVRPAALLTQQPDAPFTAGKWCRFCKIKTTCTTRAETALREVIDDFTDLDTVEPDSPLKQTKTLTNDQLAKILPKLGMITAWCKDLEKRAMGEIMHGRAVGDYKIVHGKSNRKWIDEAQAEAALRESKLKVGDIFVSKLVSPTQAEKLLGKGHPIMASQVHKPPGVPKLAPGSDKRPVLELDITQEFDSLDESDSEFN